jgi:flagellar hook-associated protein 3 FlgL
MRITHQMTTQLAIQNMGDSAERLAQLQSRAYGKSFQTVSDQPETASQALKLHSRLQALEGYQKLSAQAGERFDAQEIAFTTIENLAVQAINTITSGMNDTMNAKDRAGALATQIDSFLNEAVDVGNSTHNGEFLFSGYQINTKPFSLTDPNTIAYSGDLNAIRVRISPNETVTTNFDGKTMLEPFLNQLIAARNALTANDTATLGNQLTLIQGSLESISQAHSENGLRSRQAASATTRIEDSLLEVKSMLSQREDVDLAEAISQLRNQETTYQAVLEVSQRAISALNLFEYLR